jgi:arylsulfatase A-like enzyme
MQAPSRPNVLLILTDQWRADCLGFDNHPLVKTPHIDELFLDGIHFRQAYSACPTCIPARACLWTGRGARSLGLVGYDHGFPWDFSDTLAGTLATAGYHTQLVGKMHASPSRSLVGFHNVVLHDGTLGYHRRAPLDYTQFDDYSAWLRERLGPDADLRDTGLGVNSWVVNTWPYEERYHPTNWAATQSIEFLKRRDPTRPFFLTASFVRPHPPFDPPAHHLERYLNRDQPAVPVGDWVPDPGDEPRKGLRASFGRGKVDGEQLARARAAYYALITHVDHQINRILLSLADHGVLKNTLILFASDHGELLGDHHLWAKAMPFDGSARIPLVVRPPLTMDVPRARQVDSVVELRDLYPTICDICGVEVPAAVQGRSLLPLIEQRADKVRDHLHGEHFFGVESNQWITDGRYKYVWFSQTGNELLFNLENDPRELTNLIADEPDQLARLRRLLIEELHDAPEGFVRNGKLVTGRPQSARVPAGDAVPERPLPELAAQ